MKWVFVCGFCNDYSDSTSSDEITVEVNGRDKVMYFVCPKCKKMNTIDLTPKLLPPSHIPLPRTSIRR